MNTSEHHGAALACQGDPRRLALFGNADWNGIDFLEVADDQLSLCVHFFGQVPSGLTPANVLIEGGRRVTGIGVLALEVDLSEDPQRDGCLCIKLDKFGDFSVYRLCLVNAADRDLPPHGRPALDGFDPRYACLAFSFKTDCPSQFDCLATPPCAPDPAPVPEIDYLAKDYQGFRQLMLDRLALTLPDWRERHVPDLGLTLVELLAYSADMLSYYQDAVASEAYLDTARQRISVRRHVRLLDYRLGEGCNARAWLALRSARTHAVLPRDVYFASGSKALARINGSAVVDALDAQRLPPSDHHAYLPLLAADATGIDMYRAHNEITIYTWGDSECVLAQGATAATLLDQVPATSTGTGTDIGTRTSTSTGVGNGSGSGTPGARILHLKVGDVLIFEEVLGPLTGAAPDRNLEHRHAVRLTAVKQMTDGLLGQQLLDVEWARADALPFALCLAVRLGAPACRLVRGVTVARGNIMLVEHGLPVTEDCGVVKAGLIVGECACEGSIVDVTQPGRPVRLALQQTPLTHRAPLAPRTPASLTLQQDPRQAQPVLWLSGTPAGAAAAGSQHADHADHAELAKHANHADHADLADNPAWRWEPRADLLGSDWQDQHFVVETDDEGVAHLRFGDGEMGARPAPGTHFRAHYQIGNGVAGNVGAETITYVVCPTPLGPGLIESVGNPLPAVGGKEPEPVMEAKLTAPSAFRQVLQRAVSADDYAAIAQRDARIERADAHLLWNGSWYEACVALDPLGQETASNALRRELAGSLYPFRRIGHDLSVRAARYVALELTLEVCVGEHYLRAHVAAALTDAFSNRRIDGGKLGFFHPDRLSFGALIAVSAIVGVAQAIEGVETVCVAALQRYAEAPNDELASGFVRLGPGQIAQLDNDPDFPEHGKLTLLLRGGR